MRSAPARKPDLEAMKSAKEHFAQADTISLDVELITPLFGGGVEAKKVDEVCWLRGSEVKASLRFWWRALYGHRYATPKELHAAESERFGSAKGNEGVASPVAVGVVELSRPESISAGSINDARKVAYFPGQDGMGGAAPASLLPPGAKAKLTLQFRSRVALEIRKEFQEALVAWLVFGGAGSRTRRGAGAIAPSLLAQAQSIGYPTSVESLDSFLLRISEPVAGFQGSFFSLRNRSKVLRSVAGQAQQAAHINLMDHWRSLRQNRRHPNHWGGGQNWGQNRWPEADLVREITGAPLGNHTCHPQHRGLRQVPRALLGLPIIIHFPHQPQGSRYQLISRHSDRYGSPVWLGVARTWNNDQPTHFGVVAATPFLLGGADLRFEIQHQGNPRQTGPLQAAYPSPRAPRDNHEPGAWPVEDAAHMVLQVTQAFRQPGRGHESVAAPHFQIIR